MIELEHNPNQNQNPNANHHLTLKTTTTATTDINHNNKDEEKRRQYRRLILLLTKPSYSLVYPSPRLNARHESRTKLRNILKKLIRVHNWGDASGVLSVLLKATVKDCSLLDNRLKYWVAMELLRHVEEGDGEATTKKIGRVRDTWKRKIRSYRNKPVKDRLAAMESVLSYLVHNVIGGVWGGHYLDHITLDKSTISMRLQCAHVEVGSLKFEQESMSKPLLDLVKGLTSYEMWCTSLPEEFQFSHSDESCIPVESDMVADTSSGIVEDPKWADAASVYESHANLYHNSETSVVNDKNVIHNSNHLPNEAYSKLSGEQRQQFKSQGFYMNSSETSGNENDCDRTQHPSAPSAFNAHIIQKLLPLRLPSSEDMVDRLSPFLRNFHDTYEDALKHLRQAFDSPSPVSEVALLPLVQLLLVRDQVMEASTTIENCCNRSSSVLPLRLKARLLECISSNDHEKLLGSYEDVLKKDPTCGHSLVKLISFHQRGDYAPERLVEMIAVHLEVTQADSNIWGEFASCLLKLNLCEEDRMSTCINGHNFDMEQRGRLNFSRIHALLVRGPLSKVWKLRCKWWLKSHFSKSILASEMAAGNLQLMTYKAACATHLYGTKFEYVVEVTGFVKENDATMFTILNVHAQNSVGLFSNLVGN